MNSDCCGPGYRTKQGAHGIPYRTREVDDPKRENLQQLSLATAHPWYQTVAFCRWLSAVIGNEITLPTEQQWQWAAQNGMEKRDYPWGEWDGRRCNTREADVGCSMQWGCIRMAAAACGALDMEGSLWEWCLNKYDQPRM